MVTPQHSQQPIDTDRDVVEFRFEARAPIALRDLASSFAALDTIYGYLSSGGDRLSVMELRSGSIIAVLAPFMPMMNQMMPIIGATTTLSDFTRKMKKAIDGFMETKEPMVPSEEVHEVAAEIAEVMKPLAGRNGAEFGFAHVKYRSKTGERVVEFEAKYEGSQIDRAVLNAERFAELPPSVSSHIAIPEESKFLQGVEMVLHQANRGPAKARGATGDKGIVEAICDKPLPVYFAEGVNKLKDRMIRSAKNPLKYIYVVDLYVRRESGQPKSYTVVEVHKAAPLVSERALPIKNLRHQQLVSRRKR